MGWEEGVGWKEVGSGLGGGREWVEDVGSGSELGGREWVGRR